MSFFSLPTFDFGANNGVAGGLSGKIAPTLGGTTLNRTTRRPKLSQPSSSSLSNFMTNPFMPLGQTAPSIGTFTPTNTITTAPIDVGSNLLSGLTNTAAAVLSSIGSTGDGAPMMQPISNQTTSGGGGGGLMDNPLMLAGLVLVGGFVVMKMAK